MKVNELYSRTSLPRRGYPDPKEKIHKMGLRGARRAMKHSKINVIPSPSSVILNEVKDLRVNSAKNLHTDPSPDRPSLAPMRGALFGKNSTFFSESAGTGRSSGRPPLKQSAASPQDDVTCRFPPNFIADPPRTLAELRHCFDCCLAMT